MPLGQSAMIMAVWPVTRPPAPSPCSAGRRQPLAEAVVQVSERDDARQVLPGWRRSRVGLWPMLQVHLW